MKKVRVRYAPSPTGQLHIGGARAALFNYLYAKKYNGDFVVRIEDTDVERNIEGGEKSQLENLRWLGVDYDESADIGGDFGPYRQLERLDLYTKYANELLEKGFAYKCYCTAEELSAEREKLTASGSDQLHYQGRCSALTKQQEQAFIDEKRPYTIRLRVPKGETYEFDDLVKGTVAFNSNDIGDWVIVKQNGIPTYNFAVVIDDYLMEISHVLRGEDHLTNTAKQIGLYQALNFEVPIFGHMTLIVNDSGKKLSKRDESILQFIEQYKELGYLPEAMFNFLALLGWSPAGENEILSRAELIECFDEARLSKSPAKFDKEKMTHINNVYMKKLETDNLVELCKPFLVDAEIGVDKPNEWFVNVIELFKDRLSYGAQIVEFYKEAFDKEFLLSVEQVEQIKQFESKELLEYFVNGVNELTEFNAQNLQVLVKESGKATKTKGKALFMSLRLAATAQNHGPDLPAAMAILGKDELIKRINKTVDDVFIKG